MTIKPPSFLVIQGHQHSWHEKEYFAFFSWVLIIALVEKTTEIYFLCSAYEKHLWKSDILIIKNADQLPVFFLHSDYCLYNAPGSLVSCTKTTKKIMLHVSNEKMYLRHISSLVKIKSSIQPVVCLVIFTQNFYSNNM